MFRHSRVCCLCSRHSVHPQSNPADDVLDDLNRCHRHRHLLRCSHNTHARPFENQVVQHRHIYFNFVIKFEKFLISSNCIIVCELKKCTLIIALSVVWLRRCFGGKIWSRDGSLSQRDHTLNSYLHFVGLDLINKLIIKVTLSGILFHF